MSKTYLKVNTDITLYISNTGNDNTADGTENKPFKTLKKCLNKLKESIITNCIVTIKFLSDYEETLTSMDIRNNNVGSYFTINGNGHNVTLCTIRLFQGFFIVQNLNVKETDVNSANVYVSENAYVFFRNANVKSGLLFNSNHAILSNRNATIIIDGTCNIDINKTNGYAVGAMKGGKVIFDVDTSALTVNGTAKSLFYAIHGGAIHAILGTVAGSFTGQKYILSLGSLLNLNGRGTGILVGSEGTKDETSIIC